MIITCPPEWMNKLTICTFTLQGPPVGKQRAIPIVEGGRLTGKKTPKKTRMFEEAIANVANLALPATWRKDRLYGLFVGFTGRPDIDNVYKAVSDALNRLAWNDDRQVEYGGMYRLHNEPPRTEVRVEAYG